MMSDQSVFARLARQWESPPTWLALFLALALLQSRALPLLPPVEASRALGTLLVLAGAVLFLLALREFRRHGTTVVPREAPTALIETGVFRLSRNPIYLADALILAGVTLWWDAAALWLVPVFVLVIRRRFIEGEEAALRAAFGPAFEAYAARTRRWL